MIYPLGFETAMHLHVPSDRCIHNRFAWRKRQGRMQGFTKGVQSEDVAHAQHAMHNMQKCLLWIAHMHMERLSLRLPYNASTSVGKVFISGLFKCTGTSWTSARSSCLELDWQWHSHPCSLDRSVILRTLHLHSASLFLTFVICLAFELSKHALPLGVQLNHP